ILPKNCAVLLECMGNLLANEMFRSGEITDPTDKILKGIKSLKKQSQHLVIVTNNVSCDGIDYEKGTLEYIRIMGRINRRMTEIADNVTECVYGIPLILKGQLL
ncbi:MAG: bifunctional adenosylcobinamide kinase/adenosylcobinamide-phosphate guanylyltransferase, partial [Oscillospiraceae bacterium]|nr:bifunctional adenosylcobinamide kinase/adenosylcobinamide-phosphate guanylyltransferase [Oscillospiraceae bacterium]